MADDIKWAYGYNLVNLDTFLKSCVLKSLESLFAEIYVIHAFLTNENWSKSVQKTIQLFLSWCVSI